MAPPNKPDVMWVDDPIDDDAYEKDDLRFEDRHKHRLLMRHIAHSHCRDPEHYGCSSCMPEEFGVTDTGHHEEESE